MSTDTLNLLPCPFCGSKSISEQFDDGLFWVKCSSCGSTGPANTRYSGTDGEEVRDWNTRGVVSQGEIPVIDLKAIREKMIQAYRTAKEDQPYVASARIDAIIEEIRPYLSQPVRESGNREGNR